MEPATPYYAVIFTSKMNPLNEADAKEYLELGSRMEDLARELEGFLGVDSVRDSTRTGITVSYWKSLENIKQWKLNAEHTMARNQRSRFYQSFATKITKVEREYKFSS